MRTRRERRLYVAVTLLGIVALGVLGLVLVALWRRGNDNLAGWVTTAVAGLALYGVTELLELEQRFQRARPRVRMLTVLGTVLLAVAGGLVYVAWPGADSWYLAALPALPALVVCSWFPPPEDEVGGFSGGDGPWSAP